MLTVNCEYRYRHVVSVDGVPCFTTDSNELADTMADYYRDEDPDTEISIRHTAILEDEDQWTTTEYLC